GTYLFFYPDGRVYYPTTHISAESFEGINPWADSDEHTRFWGSYTINGKEGEMIMPYGKIPFTLNDKGPVLTTQNTKHQYKQVPTVDGVVFDGTYYFPGDWGKKANPEITFTAEGKSVDRGVTNILNQL